MGQTTVLSGVPYVVSAIDGRRPSSLDDFIGAHRLLLTRDGHESVVDGLGLQIGPSAVTFTEKLSDAGGKDVREWKITLTAETGFCAEHQAKF